MRTTDVDRLHDLAPGWVEQSFQLGRGQFEGSLSFGQTSRMQFAVKDWRPGLLVRGSAPKGTAVLGFPLVDSRLAGCAGCRSPRPISATSAAARKWISAVPPLPGLPHCDARGGARSVCRDRPWAIAPVARARPPAPRRAQCGGTTARGRAPRPRCRLPRHAQADRSPGCGVGGEPHPGFAAQRLPFDERRRHVPGSAALARRAEDYLLTNLQAPLTIRDLCEAMRASERTLHLAFKVHLGTTPKAHLKALRLNAVRRELRRAGPGVGVMDVAMRWGFFHAGWLSQDYGACLASLPARRCRRASRLRPSHRIRTSRYNPSAALPRSWRQGQRVAPTIRDTSMRLKTWASCAPGP